MKSNKIKAFSVLGLSLAVQTAFAGNITAINVSALPDNQKVVKVRFDRDVVSPTGFVTTTPSSIALDFPNTSIALAQPDLEYADPLLGKITAAQNNDRARILLGLNSAGQYNTEIRGNEVWIYVSAATNVSNQSTYTPVATSTTSPQIGASATVDFRKASKTSGIIDVSVPGFNGTPIIKRQPDRVVITLKNYPLPTQAQRNLDVTDFDTPVKSVVMKRLGNDTEITIRNQGNWELQDRSSKTRLSYQITRKDNLESAGFKQTSKSFSGKRISLDFQDVDVRTVLQILGKESGMNIVASDSVTGKITISVKDVPWDQALDLVMQARNLDKRQQGNIINIAPRDELLEKDKAVLKAQQDLEQMGPLYSQTFQLKYKNVEEFRKVLRLDETSNNPNSNTRSILSSRGSALIDPATNTLIITDNPAVLQKFQKLIAELDVPARQVMIEARIVEATSGFSRELGVTFGRTSNSAGRTTWNSNVNVPISAAPSGTLTLVRALSSASLNLTLQARQAENEVRIVSSPRVLTQDRKAATIQSGFEVPYQVVSDGTVSYEFKSAVLGMTVTPHITPDGQIIMDLQINKDSPENCDAEELCIRTRNVKTNAMVEDGGTLIVGGIYEETNDNRQTKVPLLGDIPVVGNLFKSRSRGIDRSELLIFITPRIMDNSGNSLRY